MSVSPMYGFIYLFIYVYMEVDIGSPIISLVVEDARLDEDFLHDATHVHIFTYIHIYYSEQKYLYDNYCKETRVDFKIGRVNYLYFQVELM